MSSTPSARTRISFSRDWRLVPSDACITKSRTLNVPLPQADGWRLSGPHNTMTVSQEGADLDQSDHVKRRPRGAKTHGWLSPGTVSSIRLLTIAPRDTATSQMHPQYRISNCAPISWHARLTAARWPTSIREARPRSSSRPTGTRRSYTIGRTSGPDCRNYCPPSEKCISEQSIACLRPVCCFDELTTLSLELHCLPCSFAFVHDACSQRYHSTHFGVAPPPPPPSPVGNPRRDARVEHSRLVPASLALVAVRGPFGLAPL